MAELKTQTTAEQLTIDYAPWVTGVILIGASLLFLAFGLYGFIDDQISPLWWYGSFAATLLFAAVFVERERLTLNATDQTLDYRKQTVFGPTHVQAKLDQIAAIRLVEQTSRGGSSFDGADSSIILRQIAVQLPTRTVRIPSALVGGPAIPTAHKLTEAWLTKARA